jgi:hypothetical protein
MTRSLACGLLAALALLALPAAAGAAKKEGALTDPAGDAASHRDITDVKVTYDTGGIITADVTLAALPDASSTAIVAVRFGETVDGVCAPQRPDKPILLAAASIPAGERQMAFLRGGAVEPLAPPTSSVAGTTISLTGKDRELQDRPFDCSSVAVGGSGGNTAEDSTDVIKLKGAGGGQAKKLRRALKRCRSLDTKRERKRCAKRARARFGD